MRKNLSKILLSLIVVLFPITNIEGQTIVTDSITGDTVVVLEKRQVETIGKIIISYEAEKKKSQALMGIIEADSVLISSLRSTSLEYSKILTTERKIWGEREKYYNDALLKERRKNNLYLTGLGALGVTLVGVLLFK